METRLRLSCFSLLYILGAAREQPSPTGVYRHTQLMHLGLTKTLCFQGP